MIIGVAACVSVGMEGGGEGEGEGEGKGEGEGEGEGGEGEGEGKRFTFAISTPTMKQWNSSRLSVPSPESSAAFITSFSSFLERTSPSCSKPAL